MQTEAQARGVARGLIPWPDMRNHLTAAFLSSDEAEHARREEEVIRQATTETVPSCNRWFRDLAATAYVASRNADQHREMIRHYASGLVDDGVARNIIRHRPRYVDIEAAMMAAIEIMARNDEFDRLGRRETSMKVCVVTPSSMSRADKLVAFGATY